MASQIQSIARRVVVEERRARAERLAHNAQVVEAEAALSAHPDVAPLAAGYYARLSARRKGKLKRPVGKRVKL